MKTAATQVDIQHNMKRHQMNVKHHNRVTESSKPLLQLFLLLALLALGDCASVSCCSVCDCKSREVWCERRALTSIPTNIPVNTRRIFLFDNEIAEIPDGSLSNLKDLELLDLSSNKLTDNAIRPGMLSELTSLSDLNLSENKLTIIKKNVFSGIGSLLRLYIENNKIGSIEPTALSNMSNLVELKLSNNRLSHFPKIVACPKLQRLCLSHNRLERLQFASFSDVNLEQLTLSFNHLNQLPSVTFRDTSNMRELDISNNRISRLPRSISNMSSLQMLNLSGNSISSLPSNFLGNLRRMKALDLQGLRLTTLPKGFIPRRVYLNIFDISNNPWNCDCAMSWLPEYMRAVEGAITRLNEVKCSVPRQLQGRQIVALHRDNFACGRNSAVNHIRPSVHPRRKPTVDLCDGLSCANGATCFINPTTRRPACRCLPGWKGLLCDRPIISPTKSTFRTTTSTRSPGNNDNGQLLIREDSLTANSVDILFPTVGKRIIVTTTEILPEEVTGQTNTVLVQPDKYLYTVKDLLPEKIYKICISSAETLRSSRQGARSVEDKLCGKVTTAAVSDDMLDEEFTDFAEVENENVIRNVENNDVDVEPILEQEVEKGNGAKTYQNSDNSLSQTTDESEFDLLYPVLGACLAVIIILVVLFFVCRRNRSKLKHVSNNHLTQTPEHESATTGGFLPPKDNEKMPMMSHSNQYTPQHTAHLLHGDVYQTTKQNYLGYPQGFQRTVTPSKTESLGRSSNSGGSIKGVQPHLDMQRCSSSNSNPRYLNYAVDDTRGTTTPIGGISYSTEDGPYRVMLSNRGPEYVYKHHGSPVPVEMDGKPIIPIASFPASTAINQYNQGPISTSVVSPLTVYQPMNNNAAMQASGYQTSPPEMTTRQTTVHSTSNNHSRSLHNPHLNCDSYYPGLTTPHKLDNSMRHVYKDTLVM